VRPSVRACAGGRQREFAFGCGGAGGWAGGSWGGEVVEVDWWWAVAFKRERQRQWRWWTCGLPKAPGFSLRFWRCLWGFGHLGYIYGLRASGWAFRVCLTCAARGRSGLYRGMDAYGSYHGDPSFTWPANDYGGLGAVGVKRRCQRPN